MRTLIFIAAGLLLAVLALRLAPPTRRGLAALAFAVAWLGVSAWNLLTGLSHGYTLAQELPIHVALFGIPAALAWGLWWRGRP
ncbi:hypothetical protein E6C76_10865 [Pseudothauera nasutitermitis]|uniref:Uncharacterized protein n=1 Tax=Pseudothauera nasutitermitis TaxID=2565930 RepID=A0A4S4B106_9RHOO|nr:hypothetical protein [Pseudothauera nasutitermitis]THF64558.1 hypothetical protein E6C76_10865 [Pseudothauera nasutitermitis]